MKAIVHHAYGPPDEVLALQDVDEPAVERDELLLRVHAAGVNPGDWYVLWGTPYVLRAASGLVRPRHQVLGLAVAGTVESVGRDVSRFRPGDEVYAEVPRGGFAEYARVPVDAAARTPANVGFEQAAAVPVVGVTALQALRDVAQVQPGQQVLITGASGGVGTFAVQVAKTLGAEVTGVCSTASADLVESIGADHVVDYTRQDFTRGGQTYDLILDNVGNRSLSELRRALVPGGMLIPNSNRGGRWIGGYVRRATHALVVSPFVRQRLRPFSASGKGEDLATLTELVEAGKVTPVIDRTYALSRTAEALGYYGQGHARGKVVIAVRAADRGADKTWGTGDERAAPLEPQTRRRT